MFVAGALCLVSFIEKFPLLDFSPFGRRPKGWERVRERPLFLSLKHAVHFSLVVFLLERLALVVLLLTLGKGNDEFGQALLIDEESGGDDGEAWVLLLVLQVAQFFLAQQELAFTACRMVIVRTVEILRYVHVLHLQLSVNEIAVGVHEAGFAEADRLDFRSRKHNACGIGIYELIVERRLLVLYVYRSRLFLFHQPRVFDRVLNKKLMISGENTIATVAIIVNVSRFSSDIPKSTSLPSHTM